MHNQVADRVLVIFCFFVTMTKLASDSVCFTPLLLLFLKDFEG